MSTVIVNSRVGPDGMLNLSLPLGAEVADAEVRVTIEPVKKPMTQAEWQAFIRRTAGSWKGEFERPPQGELEVRDMLP